jgi:hypothetical protein
VRASLVLTPYRLRIPTSGVFMSRVPPVGVASPTGDIKKRQERGTPTDKSYPDSVTPKPKIGIIID